jgi:dUTP pyrophosphatase
MLYCKKLDERAKLPTVSHPGEDLGYDLYSIQDVILYSHFATRVRTGIAARFMDDNARYTTLGGNSPKIEDIYGLLFRDRSSMAARGITVSGGVIDAGYTGELIVVLINHYPEPIELEAGSKIVQMIPMKVLTKSGSILVDELPISSRADNGFGSTGN